MNAKNVNNKVDSKANSNIINISDLINEIKKYKKNAFLKEGKLKDIDKDFLKKIKIKRNEVMQLKKKIEANDMELDKAFEAFENIYYANLDAQILADTKDKVLAPKTLLHRKSVRDYDLKIDKLIKEYNEVVKENSEELQNKKKNYTQLIMDLDRKRKSESAKERKSRQAELSRLNKALSETNDRDKINELNERINAIKKETLDGIREVEEKYINQRKDIDINNIEFLREDELNQVKMNYDFEINKSQIIIQKRKDILNFDLENKKYMLEVRETDAIFKKDLVLKKNGALVAHDDNNKELYRKLIDSIDELNNLQIEYNSRLLDCVKKDYKERLDYENDNIRFLAVDVNLSLDKLKKDSPFALSLSRFNKLYLEHLKSCVQNEYDNILNNVRLAYSSFMKADYQYKDMNEKITKLFDDFYHNTIKNVSSLYEINQKLEAGIIKNFKTANDEINTIIQDRQDIYEELNNKINNCIYHYALGDDEEIIKYKDEDKIRKLIDKNKRHYLIGEYKSIDEEMDAIESIYREQIDKVNKEKAELDVYIQDEEKKILDDEAREKELIEKNYNDKKISINEEYDKQKEEVMNNYKIQIKKNEEDYKTENKLL